MCFNNHCFNFSIWSTSPHLKKKKKIISCTEILRCYFWLWWLRIYTTDLCQSTSVTLNEPKLDPQDDCRSLERNKFWMNSNIPTLFALICKQASYHAECCINRTLCWLPLHGKCKIWSEIKLVAFHFPSLVSRFPHDSRSVNQTSVKSSNKILDSKAALR